jgi:hypothetical protein
MHLILKDRDRRCRISIHIEIVRAALGQKAVVAAVQVNDVLSTFDPFGITRYGNDVLEDDIVSQQVEVVLAIGEAQQPFSNDVEKRAISSKV